MKIKKDIYKCCLFGCALIPLTCSYVSCSNHSKQKPQPEPEPTDEPQLAKISIDMDQKEFDVEATTQFISQPLSIECFDQNGHHFETNTQWCLSQKDGDDVPNWININGNNEIVITLPRIMESQYDFEIQAESIDSDIKSNVEEFVVNITGESPKAPDSILIECDKKDYDIFYTSTGNIEMGIRPFSQQYPVEVLDRNCEWSISKITGNDPFDLDKSPLFYLEGENDKKSLKISSNVDSTYCEKTFNIEIKAVSLLNQTASSKISINITFKNGFYYTDENTKFVYTRETLDEDWSLTLVPEETATLENVKESIFDIPVTKISDEMSAKSNAKKIVFVILPDCITEIGKSAFARQSYLYTIKGSGITKVGEYAFYSDLHLSFSVVCPKPKFQYIGNYAFYGCSSLDIIEQDTAVSFGDYAFYGTKINNVTLGPNLIQIGNCCFSNCASLNSLTLQTPTPPHLDGVLFSGTTSISYIRVPNLSLNLYKNDESWQNYKNYFIGY